MKKNEEKHGGMGELSAFDWSAMKTDFVALNVEAQMVMSCQLMAGTAVFSKKHTTNQTFIVKLVNGRGFLVIKELAKRGILPVNVRAILRLMKVLRPRTRALSCLLWLLVCLFIEQPQSRMAPRIALKRRRLLPYRSHRIRHLTARHRWHKALPVKQQ